VKKFCLFAILHARGVPLARRDHCDYGGFSFVRGS
jgi:hypothetical protein